MTSGNVEKKKSSTNSFEEFIISWLPQLTTFILILFIIPILLLVIFCVVVISYNTHTESISTLISTANNLISPILSLFTLILSAITAYFLIKQFQSQSIINNSQNEINNQILDQMKVSTSKLYIDYYGSLLDNCDKNFYDLLNDKYKSGDTYNDTFNSIERVSSLSQIITKVSSEDLKGSYSNIQLFDIYTTREAQIMIGQLASFMEDFSTILVELDKAIKSNKSGIGIAELEMKAKRIGREYFRGENNLGINGFIFNVHKINDDIIVNNLTPAIKSIIEKLIDSSLESINKSITRLVDIGFIESESTSKNIYKPVDADSSSNITPWNKTFDNVYACIEFNEYFTFKVNK